MGVGNSQRGRAQEGELFVVRFIHCSANDFYEGLSFSTACFNIWETMWRRYSIVLADVLSGFAVRMASLRKLSIVCSLKVEAIERGSFNNTGRGFTAVNAIRRSSTCPFGFFKATA